MEKRLATDLADRLDELGLRFVELVDFAELEGGATVLATLEHGGQRERYRVGYSDSLTFSSLGWARRPSGEHARPMVVGPRMTERSASMFRQWGINYLDQAGNAYVTFGGVHIDVRGRKAPRRADAQGLRPARGGVNLFSAKRSQVIFVLLSWPEMLQGPVREIAMTAGVSLGQAHETLELLLQYGFLGEGRRLAHDQRVRLIDQWTAAYPTGLGSASRTEYFSGDWSGIEPSGTVYLSGEAAVPTLLRPETAVLYTDGLPLELIRERRWRRDGVQPNIFIRRLFWHAPQAHVQPGIHDAPWLLIYADLLASTDSRQREAAQHLREAMQ